MAKPTMYPQTKLIKFRDDTLEALKKYRRDREDLPSESEAIRDIIDRYLIEHGYLERGKDGPLSK